MGIRSTIFILTCGLLAGCALGPDFRKPAAPDVKGYTAQPLPEKTVATDTTGGASQRFVQGMDLPGEWWTLFHSEPLNRLIKQALEHNPDLAAAQAALRVSKEGVAVQQGAFLPSIGADFSAQRQKSPSTLSPVPNSNTFLYNLFTPEVTVSYMPDVFGLNRRTVESLKAQQEMHRFQLEATYLTLTSNMVLVAVQDASLRGQIAATQKLIASERESLELFKKALALGQVAELDVAGQESALAQAEQTLPPLQKQLAQNRDLLTALLGKLPSEEPAETFELADLHLPEDLPVSLPSKLVEQRPDIRAAEENLHSASAQIGVAVANRFPNITLTAATGSTALVFSDLFKGGTGFWSIAGDVAQPIFQGGALMHKERAARAAYEEAAAQYRSAVIAAFQNVADALRALQYDGDALRAAARSENAARRTLDFSRTQLKLGQISYLTLLTSEEAYQQAAITLVQAQAGRYADTAALFQALGGGWWNRSDVEAEGEKKDTGKP